MTSNSAFEIIGPPMVGPSSSHTAGAVRIGLLARHALGSAPVRAEIGLHGSFAATGTGHATDRGLISGLLGFAPDDERLKHALDLAKEAHLEVFFSVVDLGESAHPNTARLRLTGSDGDTLELTGSSVGGGNVEITHLDSFSTLFTGAFDALMLWHQDRAGFLAHVTAVLACVSANIATIRTARTHRNADALTLVELDAPPLAEVCALLDRADHIRKVRVTPKLS